MSTQMIRVLPNFTRCRQCQTCICFSKKNPHRDANNHCQEEKTPYTLTHFPRMEGFRCQTVKWKMEIEYD